MERDKELELADILRNIARYTSLAIGIIVIVYALFTKYDDYGEGISGIINNSTNLLPWTMLLVSIYIAWNWEILGGVIISLFGIAMLYFFNFKAAIFFSIGSVLAVFVVLLGFSFVFSGYLRKNKK